MHKDLLSDGSMLVPLREPRRCVLCDAQAESNEHILPKWMRALPAVAAVSKGLTGTKRHLYVSEAKVLREGFSVFQPELRTRPASATLMTVKVLCVKCNSGMLSGRERRIKATLSAVIEGQQTKVHEEHLVRIAAWATKTSMMFEFDDPKTAAFSREQRYALRSQEKPPHDTDVWLGRWDGAPDLVLMHSGGIVGEVSREDAVAALLNPPVGENLQRIGVTRLVAGSLALFVASTAPTTARNELAQMLPAVSDAWVQIWPNPPEYLNWPLKAGVNDGDLNSLRV